MKRTKELATPRVLRAIVKELDGREWSADTLDAIAGHLRAAGFEIREPLDETGDGPTVESYDERQARMEAAFAKVRNTENWKLPINAVLPADTTREAIEEIRAAVIYFTGSVPTVFTQPDLTVRVQAAGYYEAIGS